MQKRLNALLGKIGKLILAEVLQPLEDIKKSQTDLNTRFAQLESKVERVEKRIEKLHEVDPLIVECDLASLDNQICTRIAKCRDRGYTTAEDRRIVGRMHEAYKARGGNHGEENEYRIFLQLPTEEAYWNSIGGGNS